MRRALHKALLPVLVLALGIAAALLALTFGPVPSGHFLPNPNGYDDFLRAGNLLVGNVSAFRDLDQNALHGLILSNAEPLRFVRLGLSRVCSFPTDFALTNHDWMGGDLAHLKNLAFLLRADGRLAELEHRPEDAAACYLQAIRFGNEISRGGFIINRLVGIACEAIGQDALVKLTPTLASKQSRPLITELESIDQGRVSFQDIRRNERRFTRHELLTRSNPVEWITSWRQTWTAIRWSARKDKAIIARERLLMTELALRCYQSDQGRVTPRLDDLVSHYVARVPLDPFSGQPLVYHPQATSWLLYSVGPDGVDDGGVSVAKGAANKGDLLLNSPW